MSYAYAICLCRGMGKGSLNRLLLTADDAVKNNSDTDANSNSVTYELKASDPRSMHIRTLLAHTSSFTLRVAVAPAMLHDAATATVCTDGRIHVVVPLDSSRPAPPPPPVALLVAMQRPKVIGRVLEAAAALGVSIVCVVAAEKVEKSYWDCKLFRANDDENDGSAIVTESQTNGNGLDTSSQTNDEALVDETTLLKSGMPIKQLPGRPRGLRNHPHRDRVERAAPQPRRVDDLPAVHRRLREAVQQASADAVPPIVLLERCGLSAVLAASHPFWRHISINATRVVTHPYPVPDVPFGAITNIVSRGSPATVLAIGPEGGWTESELQTLATASFSVASLGPRVLRSETATVVALGLVHEGLRLRELRSG